MHAPIQPQHQWKYAKSWTILQVFNKLLRVLMCRLVALSSRVPTDGMRNLSTITSVPVQPQTPMQYRPAQSMPPSLTDAMRNFSIGTSTRVASVRYKASHLGNHGFAYDGNKSAFAAGPLPFENKEFVIVVPEKDGKEKLLGDRYLALTWQWLSTTVRGLCQSSGQNGMGLSLSHWCVLLLNMSNAHQAETGQSLIEEQALEIGSRKSVRKLFGSYDLLDLIKSFQIGRQKEIQSLLEVGPVTNFAHRNHPQSLLKGRFLRFVQDKKSTSVPVQERHRVLDYERVQLLPQTETVERSGQYHDGLDDRSQETHHFNLSQQTLELESDYDTAELRELSNRRRVSNLLQNGFGLRLDELLRSHVERKEQASQSEQQESVFENDGVSQAVQSAKGALSSPPAIPQLSRTEREIINGLRIDMVRLQEQMNSLQSTLETCMKMQHELQRLVQQEVGEDNIETCFLSCDTVVMIFF
ncbi:hypothetical protein Tco_0723157 [Tanacetum coccineum]